ncbi:MAG: MFS transporter [Actinomycetota bacterium]
MASPSVPNSVPAIGVRTLPFYLGGFLGPFGTMIIVAMLPELREQFDVDSATISWAFSAYLFPMAALLLVSGTIGERFGRRLVLRISLSGYIAASVLASLAPTLGMFLFARAVQGVGNAFITPLLIAGLAEITPPAQLGKRLGVYGSFQAAGGGLAPFAGGLAAAVDWRLAFWATALVTVFIVTFVPPGARRAGADRPPIRPLLGRRLLVLGVGTFAAAAGPIGAAILVGLKTRDVLVMDAASAGFLLAGGNLAATLLAPAFGRVLDRFGPRACGLFATSVVSLLVAALGFVGTTAATAVLYAAAGALFGFVVLVVQQVGASIVPENRGGALSAILSFRFMGHAVGPLLWVPVFEASERAAFLGAAALGLLTVLAVLVAIPRREQDAGAIPAASAV